MQTGETETRPDKTSEQKNIILELSVNNHPGVMSHICGLFARRAYNLEKILCFPKPNSSESRMWLQVNEEKRLDQVLKQIEKLEDVRHVRYQESDESFFAQIEDMLNY